MKSITKWLKRSVGFARLGLNRTFATMMASGVLVLTLPMAIAGNTLMPATAHASVLQAICDQESSHFCLNRYQGGHSAGSFSISPSGTPVIAYTNDHDNNEDFVFSQMTGVCGGGYVTSTCPFTVGSGFNTEFLNDEIVQLKDTTYNLCVGSWDNNGVQAVYTNGNLQTCANASGNGGGTGTMYIMANAGQVPGYTNGGQLVSRYWSDWFYANPQDWNGEIFSGPNILCADGKSTAVDTGLPVGEFGPSGACQWSYF